MRRYIVTVRVDTGRYDWTTKNSPLWHMMREMLQRGQEVQRQKGMTYKPIDIYIDNGRIMRLIY